MKTYFTSDIHFSDDRIRKLCNRSFDGINEADEAIIVKWNNKVGPNDTV